MVATDYDDAIDRPLREGPGSTGLYVTTLVITINGSRVPTQYYNARLMISQHIINQYGSPIARVTWLDASGKVMTFNYHLNDNLTYRRQESILR